MGLSESREPIRLRHVGVKLDKVAALSDGTIWAAGNGQVFLYDENTGRWISKATVSAPGTPAVTIGRAEINGSTLVEVGVVCFAVNRGLCSIMVHDKNNSTIRVVQLDKDNFRNHGSNFSLITPLEHHSKGKPVLFAVSKDFDTANESPLSLLQLQDDDLSDQSTINKPPRGFAPYMELRNGYSMMFENNLRPTIKYLHAFQYNGFAFVVTVQPMITSNTKAVMKYVIFETRVARFCLDNKSMKSYTEIPISCKTNDRRYDVAAHARHIIRGSNYTLLVTMGEAEKNVPYPSIAKPSALCAFNVDSLSSKFSETTKHCREAARADIVRQSNYYQKHDPRIPIQCQQSLEKSECNPKENKYIVGMRTFEGNVVFASQRKNPPDVTYIYNRTRSEGVPVGTLTTFEVEEPEGPIDSEPIYIWVADHQDQVHRVLITSTFAIHLVTVDTKFLKRQNTDLRDAVYSSEVRDYLGSITESAHSAGRIHFLKQDEVLEIDTRDTCAFYLNCGDCLNPHQITDGIVGCEWKNGRCTPGKGNNHCAPFVDIKESGPFEGPDEGGNNLIIKGLDFGNPAYPIQSTMPVKIGNKACAIKEWSNSSITCEVPGRDTTLSQNKVEVLLQVRDFKMDERLKNYHISSEGYKQIATYTYYPVKFYGVFPSFGPDTGGTKLTLIGENIGYNDMRIPPSALIGTNNITNIHICDTFVVINRTHLTCNTTTFPTGITERRLNLSLEISKVAYPANGTNNTTELFQYINNPSEIEVDGSSKLHYFFTGGRAYQIVFRGEHLDASVEPHINIKLYGDKVITANCRAPNKTTVMCKAPSLVDHDIYLSNQPIHAGMELQFDGFLYKKIRSQLTYYPNATIFGNNIEQAVASPTGETRITIQGTYLSPLDKNDIIVQVGDRPCEVNSIIETTVVCTAQLEPGSHPVYVTLNSTDLLARTYEAEVKVIGHSASLDGSVTFAVIGSILALIVVVLLISLYYFCVRTKIEKIEPTVAFTPENDGYLNPDSERLLATIPPDPEIIQQLSDWDLLMDFSCIQVGALIGKGQFGCVYRGVLKRDKISDEEAVAIKTLQQRGYTTNDANVFLKEALRMKDFNHPNVLCLIGVSFDNNNATDPMIIVPYMANGDLLMYIRNQDNTPTVKDLITFGANIAQGMSYLTSQKFIHRDLAARNCMVGEDMIVRVADFGLSRDVYETSYYSSDNAKTKLPVKWMALESLISGHYSHKSDVWSFGVVLWELMTRGCQPYPSVDNWEVHLWLKEGRRMLQPAFCPDALYKIMLSCWHEDPEKRPTFSQLVKDVPNIIHTIEMSTRNAVPQYVNA